MEELEQAMAIESQKADIADKPDSELYQPMDDDTDSTQWTSNLDDLKTLSEHLLGYMTQTDGVIHNAVDTLSPSDSNAIEDQLNHLYAWVDAQGLTKEELLKIILQQPADSNAVQQGLAPATPLPSFVPSRASPPPHPSSPTHINGPYTYVLDLETQHTDGQALKRTESFSGLKTLAATVDSLPSSAPSVIRTPSKDSPTNSSLPPLVPLHFVSSLPPKDVVPRQSPSPNTRSGKKSFPHKHNQPLPSPDIIKGVAKAMEERFRSNSDSRKRKQSTPRREILEYQESLSMENSSQPILTTTTTTTTTASTNDARSDDTNREYHFELWILEVQSETKTVRYDIIPTHWFDDGTFKAMHRTGDPFILNPITSFDQLPDFTNMKEAGAHISLYYLHPERAVEAKLIQPPILTRMPNPYPRMRSFSPPLHAKIYFSFRTENGGGRSIPFILECWLTDVNKDGSEARGSMVWHEENKPPSPLYNIPGTLRKWGKYRCDRMYCDRRRPHRISVEREGEDGKLYWQDFSDFDQVPVHKLDSHKIIPMQNTRNGVDDGDDDDVVMATEGGGNGDDHYPDLLTNDPLTAVEPFTAGPQLVPLANPPPIAGENPLTEQTSTVATLATVTTMATTPSPIFVATTVATEKDTSLHQEDTIVPMEEEKKDSIVNDSSLSDELTTTGPSSGPLPPSHSVSEDPVPSSGPIPNTPSISVSTSTDTAPSPTTSVSITTTPPLAARTDDKPLTPKETGKYYDIDGTAIEITSTRTESAPTTTIETPVVDDEKETISHFVSENAETKKQNVDETMSEQTRREAEAEETDVSEEENKRVETVIESVLVEPPSAVSMEQDSTLSETGKAKSPLSIGGLLRQKTKTLIQSQLPTNTPPDKRKNSFDTNVSKKKRKTYKR